VSLVKPDGRVWALTDGDSAGERHGLSLLTKASPYRFVRWVKMADGKQPKDMPGEQLKTAPSPASGRVCNPTVAGGV
jgi:DNA primase